MELQWSYSDSDSDSYYQIDTHTKPKRQTGSDQVGELLSHMQHCLSMRVLVHSYGTPHRPYIYGRLSSGVATVCVPVRRRHRAVVTHSCFAMPDKHEIDCAYVLADVVCSHVAFGVGWGTT